VAILNGMLRLRQRTERPAARIVPANVADFGSKVRFAGEPESTLTVRLMPAQTRPYIERSRPSEQVEGSPAACGITENGRRQRALGPVKHFTEVAHQSV
jgi:hypothetical protein